MTILAKSNYNDRQESRTDNSTLAIGGVYSPLDSFVLTESSVLRTNICAEKPAHRQSAKRYCKAAWGTTRENIDSVWLAYFTDRQAARNLTE